MHTRTHVHCRFSLHVLWRTDCLYISKLSRAHTNVAIIEHCDDETRRREHAHTRPSLSIAAQHSLVDEDEFGGTVSSNTSRKQTKTIDVFFGRGEILDTRMEGLD